MTPDPKKVSDDWEADYHDEVYDVQDDEIEEDIYVEELDYDYSYEYDEFEQEMKDLLDEYEERRIEENGRDY